VGAWRWDWARREGPQGFGRSRQVCHLDYGNSYMHMPKLFSLHSDMCGFMVPQLFFNKTVKASNHNKPCRKNLCHHSVKYYMNFSKNYGIILFRARRTA
jgi:hypothetical protein